MSAQKVLRSEDDENLLAAAEEAFVGGRLRWLRGSINNLRQTRTLMLPFRAFEGRAKIEVVSAKIAFDERISDIVLGTRGFGHELRHRTRTITMNPGVSCTIDLSSDTSVAQVYEGYRDVNFQPLHPGAIQKVDATDSDLDGAEIVRGHIGHDTRQLEISRNRVIQQIEKAYRSQLIKRVKLATGCEYVKSMLLETDLSNTTSKLVLVPVTGVVGISARGQTVHALVGRFGDMPTIGDTVLDPVRFAVFASGLTYAICLFLHIWFTMNIVLSITVGACSGLFALVMPAIHVNDFAL